MSERAPQFSLQRDGPVAEAAVVEPVAARLDYLLPHAGGNTRLQRASRQEQGPGVQVDLMQTCWDSTRPSPIASRVGEFDGGGTGVLSTNCSGLTKME